MTHDCTLALAPADFARAIAGPVRVKLASRRPGPFVIAREEGGARRTAVFRATARPRELSPIVPRADEIDRVRCWACLVHPPLAVHTPKPRPARRGATAP